MYPELDIGKTRYIVTRYLCPVIFPNLALVKLLFLFYLTGPWKVARQFDRGYPHYLSYIRVTLLHILLCKQRSMHKNSTSIM